MPPSDLLGKGDKSAAGSRGTTAGAGAAAGAEIYGAGQSEADIHEIHFDRLHLFDEMLVDDVLKSFDVEDLVGFFWLIQSQGQTWAASPAGIEKYANRRDFLAFEIFGHLLGGGWGNVNHAVDPPWEIKAGAPARRPCDK
jgi:hypothetical protein